MRRVLVLLVGSLALVTGCGGPGEVDTADLESEVSSQLEKQFQEPVKAMDCEGPLAAEVGASVRCVLTATDDGKIGLTVTTTSADDGRVRFEAVVDDEPMEQ